ncbi:MAG: YggS family pyridoxal phosphate-dependent enzyme [Bacteroidales bacterium]|nr:YggS family pyridoxal phosphate-dependent enzyme [Bacteroidales bacterium]
MVSENIAKIGAMLPASVRLVAVSKLKPVADIVEAYEAGQRLFGENYAAELRDKQPQLPPDVEWHFIGHVQSKQIKYYINYVSLIHGVDSLDHLNAIGREAQKVGRAVRVLLQLHVASEETKFGFAPSEVEALCELPPVPGVQVCGVMGMASHTSDTKRVRDDFRTVRRVFERLKSGIFAANDDFCEVSMGMSHDWQVAVDEGSTLVRLGTSIFGERDYSKQKN